VFLRRFDTWPGKVSPHAKVVMDILFHLTFLGAVGLFLVGSTFLLSFLVRISKRKESAQAGPPPIVSSVRG
jgi:hypothetical protein